MEVEETLRSSGIVESRRPGRSAALVAVGVLVVVIVVLGVSRRSDPSLSPSTTEAAPSSTTATSAVPSTTAAAAPAAPTTVDPAGPIVEPGPGIDVADVRIEPGSLRVAGTAFVAISPQRGQLLSTDGSTWERVRAAVNPGEAADSDPADIRPVECGTEICLEVRDPTGRFVARGPAPIQLVDAGPFVSTRARVDGAARTEAGWVVVLAVSASVDVARAVADLRPELSSEIGAWSVSSQRLAVDVDGGIVEIGIEELTGPGVEVSDELFEGSRFSVLRSVDGAIWEVVGTVPLGFFAGLDVVDGDPFVLVSAPPIAEALGYVGRGGVADPWTVSPIAQPTGVSGNWLQLLDDGAYVLRTPTTIVGWTGDGSTATFELAVEVDVFDLSPDLEQFVGVSADAGVVVWSDDAGQSVGQVEIDLPVDAAPVDIARSGDRIVVSVLDLGDGATNDSVGLLSVELG